MIKITKQSLFSGAINTLEIDIEPEQYAAYQRGELGLIDQAFPKLDPGLWEFIRTGITPDEYADFLKQGRAMQEDDDDSEGDGGDPETSEASLVGENPYTRAGRIMHTVTQEDLVERAKRVMREDEALYQDALACRGRTTLLGVLMATQFGISEENAQALVAKASEAIEIERKPPTFQGTTYRSFAEMRDLLAARDLEQRKSIAGELSFLFSMTRSEMEVAANVIGAMHDNEHDKDVPDDSHQMEAIHSILEQLDKEIAARKDDEPAPVVLELSALVYLHYGLEVYTGADDKADEDIFETEARMKALNTLKLRICHLPSTAINLDRIIEELGNELGIPIDIGGGRA